MSGIPPIAVDRVNAPSNIAPGESGSTFTPGNEIESFYETVSGRRNVLHDYNTYSYNFTLASLSKDQLQNPDSYKGRVFTGGTETSDFFIVARSGGFKRDNSLAVGPNQNLATDFDEGFQAKQEDLRDKDFYIENVRFETRVGINNLGSANLTRGSFEILEPYSSTGFYTTLFNASVFAGHPNYLGAPFLLVLSFLGRKADDLDGEPEVVDRATRYLPIRITKSDMNVTEQGSRYTVEFIGFNQTMSSAVHSTTKQDISGPTSASTQQHENQDVGVVLYDFFKKHQQTYEEFYRQMWENSNKSNANLTQQLAQRASQADQLAAAGGTEVRTAGPNNTHKYSLWFASDYGGYTSGPTVFPENLSEITHSQFTSIRDSVLSGGSRSAGGQYTNAIMTSTMLQGDLPRTGGRNVQAQQTENERLEGLIDDERDKLTEATGQIETVNQVFNTEIKADVEALKNLLPADEANKISLDPLAEAEEGAEDETLLTLESLQTDLQSVQDSIGVPSGPPIGPNAPTSNVALVATLLVKIETNIQRLRNGTTAKAEAEQQIENLQEQQAENRTRGRAFHTGDIAWSWKQGIDINTVINTVILESTFAGKLQESSTLTSIQRTGMVDWFRVDTFQSVIGFDPFTMDFIYEFHYVISPYKIHYSKLPGLNIVFNTDYLKERAVREYNYLYTGKNLDVLDFGLNYNNLFFSPYVMRNPQDDPRSGTEEDEAITQQNLNPNSFPSSIAQVQNMLVTGYSMIQPVLRSTRPVHGRGVPVYPNEVAQAFQDFLFQPIADQALLRAQIKIIGDPVYVLGSGISDRPKLEFDDIETTEGEMNAFTKEVDIIFKFQNINDLPSANELESQGQPEVNINRYNGVYQLLAVNNFFEDGQFYQELSTLRRPNQPTDYGEQEPERDITLEETQVEGTGSQAEDVGAETQDGQTSETPVEDNDRVRRGTDLVPTVPPNSPVGRLIRSIAEERGISEEEVRTQIGNRVQDNRITQGDDSGRGAEATTQEIVSAATSVYPDLFPSGRSVEDIVSLFNSPLPTQDQIRQNISTPGDPRPNILDVINAGQDVYNRYANLLPGGGFGTGNGSIRLNEGARRYWGNVPAQEKTRLFDLANRVDYPLSINSSQRPTRYNAEVDGAQGSRHISGQAFDIDLSGLDYNQKVDIIQQASAAGYTGIRYYGNTLHIDTREGSRWGSNVSGDSRFDDFLDQHEEAPLIPTSRNSEG